MCTYSTCPEEPDYSANIEVRPIGRILWVLAGAAPGTPAPGYQVGSSAARAAIWQLGFSRLASTRAIRSVFGFGSFSRLASTARCGSICNPFGFLRLSPFLPTSLGGAYGFEPIGLLDLGFGFGS